MPNDEELMAAYAAGDDAAFRELFLRYAPVVSALIRRDFSRSEDARDLVQQVFLQLHRARRDYRAGAPFRPWLVTIALNVKREHLRRLGRRREAALELAPHEEAEPPPDRDAKARDVAVNAALARLPENQRDVIVLHWFQGLSFPEIATVVGAKVSAVKVRAHRGYVALRTLLHDLM